MSNELKAHTHIDYSLHDLVNMKFYLAADVDALLAEKDAEIARLKDKLDAANNQCENLINSATDIMLRQDKVKDAKCAEIESLKASHYAESVDAGMRERRLRRALWLARAERASDKARIFYFAETCGVKLNIDGYSNKEKGRTRMCTARWWRLTWLKVERLCRTKAEEYK